MRIALLVPVVTLSIGCVKDDPVPAAAPKAERGPGMPGREVRELTVAMDEMLEEQKRLKATVRALGTEVETLRVEKKDAETEARSLKTQLAKAKAAPAPAAPVVPAVYSVPVAHPVPVIECRPTYHIPPGPPVVCPSPLVYPPVCPQPERRGLFGRRKSS